MNLILTADTHRDGKKLLWLLDDAPNHDGLLVAGDLLDIFSATGFDEQAASARRWRDAVLETGRSFAWCSGNHDFFHGEDTPMACASPLWMQESTLNNRCITDGESRLLKVGDEQLVVTTIPWPAHGGELIVDGRRITYLGFVKDLLSRGRTLREENAVPWIVLNHEPPATTPLAAGYDAPEASFARRMIEAAQPDFSLHGHMHEEPTASNGCWIWQIGKTISFNPGQSLPGEPLHHISLAIRGPGDWTAVWYGANRMLRAESKKVSLN